MSRITIGFIADIDVDDETGEVSIENIQMRAMDEDKNQLINEEEQEEIAKQISEKTKLVLEEGLRQEQEAE